MDSGTEIEKGVKKMAKPYIMLVDDDESFVEPMQKRLDKRGYKIIAAYSGDEALRQMDTHRNLDVVILDVKMPGMDGIESLKEIKKKFPLVEVIMLTGHATVESAIEGMKLGAFDYLMKPCEMDVLTAKVEEAAGKKHAHEEKIEKARIEKVMSTRGV